MGDHKVVTHNKIFREEGLMIFTPMVQAASRFLCALLLCFLTVAPAHAVFINEIHYDNVGPDSGEGVEVSGATGVDLSGWSLVLYNGSTSSSYSSNVALSGVFADMQNGMGVLDFEISGLQNGSSDGIALINNLGVVTQFLSYEGTLIADSGVAVGMTSTDIGVAETAATFIDGAHSLQLTGAGRDYADFSWALGPMKSTFGEINHGQRFLATVTDTAASRSAVTVPEPSSLALFLMGIVVCVSVKILGARSTVLPA